MTIEEFASMFHSLHGECVGQKRKSLNILLDQIKPDVATVADIDLLISSIKPHNVLEEKFKLDILIHFDRYDEILDVLKRGNVLQIGKILTCWEFFGRYEYFKSVDGETLVNDLLSQTSFKTRTKIINRLSKTVQNKKQADDLFEAIRNKYGLKVAIPLLTVCNLGTTEMVVKRHKIQLTSRQLLKIVKSDYSFLAFYYENVYKNKPQEFSEAYKHALKFVAKCDTALFWNLFSDHKFKVHFGRHMSPYVLKCGRDVLSKNALYLEMFHPKLIIHERNFEQFFMKFYPKEADDFKPPCLWPECDMTKILKYVPKGKKFDIVSRCFRKAYKKPLSDFPKMYTAEMLAMMPTVEREMVLDQKINEVQQLIYLYRPEKSIPIIQNRIKYNGNLAKRQILLLQLYKTCIFHKDEDSLLMVLKYIFARHKNDAASIKVFVDELGKWPNLYKLSEEHWIYINEILYIAMSDIDFYDPSNLREIYIRHLVEKNRPFKEKLKELIISKYEKYKFVNFYYLQDSVTLREIASLLPEMFEGEVLEELSCNFLLVLIYQNKYCPKEAVPIADCHKLIEAAINKLKNPYFVMVTSYCIKNGIWFEEFDKMLWNNYDHRYDNSLLTWYAKIKPQNIADNLETLLPPRFDYLDDYILKTFTSLSQWEIPEKIVTYSLKLLKDEDYTCASFAVKALSYFTTDSFFEAVELFDPPTDGKIDITKSLEVAVQSTVANCLCNIRQPELSVNLLLKFCIGDYLKHVPVYSLAHNLRDRDLEKLLSRLLNSGVSVRHRAIILKSTLSDRNTTYNFLRSMGSSEKNTALKTVIFMRTRKWFIDELDELFWNLFKDHLDIIDDENRDVHNLLLRIEKIPQNYLPQYVSLVYAKLLRNPNIDINKKAYTLLSLIPDNVIEDFDIIFLKRGIEDTLFKDNASHYFCFKCIFQTNRTKQSILLNHTFDIFEKYVKAHWTPYVVGNVRNNVCNFINNFCTPCVQHKLENLVDLFHDRYSILFDYKENLHESLLVNFTFAYCKYNFEKFSQTTNDILSELVTMYDESVIDIFCKVLSKFLLVLVHIDEEDKLKQFLGAFYGERKSTYTYLAIVTLLKSFTKFETALDMVKLIQQCEIPTVQIYFNRYLRNV